MLPDLPSALIRVALADLKLCEEDSRYKVRMNQWHWPKKEHCEVCFAGAVMAKTLKSNPRDIKAPVHFSIEQERDTANKLLALDSFRCGELKHGVTHMCTVSERAKLPESYDSVLVAQYIAGPETFHVQMHDLANDLEEVGL